MTELFNKFINDELFLKIVEYKLKEIKKDGVIDAKDIPHIIYLIIECSKNLKHFKLTEKKLKESLEELVIYLLKNFELLNKDKEDTLKPIIKTSLDLVLLKPRFRKCLFCY